MIDVQNSCFLPVWEIKTIWFHVYLSNINKGPYTLYITCNQVYHFSLFWRKNLPYLHVSCSTHVLSIGILRTFDKPIEILETKPSACSGVSMSRLKQLAMTIKFLFFLSGSVWYVQNQRGKYSNNDQRRSPWPPQRICIFLPGFVNILRTVV